MRGKAEFDSILTAGLAATREATWLSEHKLLLQIEKSLGHVLIVSF